MSSVVCMVVVGATVFPDIRQCLHDCRFCCAPMPWFLDPFEGVLVLCCFDEFRGLFQ